MAKSKAFGRLCRRARATILAALGSGTTAMDLGDASEHIRGCRRCRSRIEQAIAKNPETTWGDSVEDALSSAQPRPRRSTWW